MAHDRDGIIGMACLALALCADPAAAQATVGMALQTSQPQYVPGVLTILYLSTGTRDTVTTAPVWGASFSPDGRQVAYSYGNNICISNTDGTGYRVVCARDRVGKEPYVTWTADNYLYWAQCTPLIYRVKTDGTGRDTVYTETTFASGDVANNIHNLGVSQDGLHASWTRPSWLNVSYDFSRSLRRDLGWGCHNPPSPDGTLLLHNTGGHDKAYIERFEDQVFIDSVFPAEPGQTANLHRYSHSSNDWIMYTLEEINIAYLHNINTHPNDSGIRLGNGIAWDFYPQEITLVTPTPDLSLSPATLNFAADVGGQPSPASDTVQVVNGVPSTTLGPVSVSTPPTWLTVAVSGTGNSQIITNTVNPAQVAGPGTYEARLTVTASGLADSAEYVVTFVYSEPPTSPIVVSSPSASASYAVGQVLHAAWNADCAEVPGVKVELSVNDGESYTIIEVSGTLPCGESSWDWTIPDSIMDTQAGRRRSIVSDQCILRVSNYNGSGSGESPVFSIVPRMAVDDGARAAGPALRGSLRSLSGGAFQVTAPVAGGMLQILRPNGSVAFESAGSGTWRIRPGLSRGTYLYRFGTSPRAQVLVVR